MIPRLGEQIFKHVDDIKRLVVIGNGPRRVVVAETENKISAFRFTFLSFSSLKKYNFHTEIQYLLVLHQLRCHVVHSDRGSLLASIPATGMIGTLHLFDTKNQSPIFITGKIKIHSLGLTYKYGLFAKDSHSIFPPDGSWLDLQIWLVCEGQPLYFASRWLIFLIIIIIIVIFIF